MREIKFRMWTGQRYIYDQNIVFDCMRQQYSGLYDHVKLHESDFEQFTGLHDKNGKEIYEGDICKHDSDINTIVFWEGAFIFNKYYIHDFALTKFAPCRTFEIIGNIHENPELIK